MQDLGTTTSGRGVRSISSGADILRHATVVLASLLPVLLLCVSCAHADLPADVEHGVIYAGENEFAGWPANEGMWQWGDEVLVGFNLTRVKQRDDYHNVDQEAYMWVNFARSLDGGKTWTTESHPEVSIPGGFDAEGNYRKQSGYPAIKKTQTSPGGINFTHPDFALKARDDRFWFSYDRGHNWEGPYKLPQADKAYIKARTNYHVIDSQTALLFYEATDIPYEQGEHLRVMVMLTEDGGKTFKRIAWLTPDPLNVDIALAKPAYACMPGVMGLEDGTVLAAVRWSVARHKWTDLMASEDGGHTWQRRSIIFNRNNNPASLIDLGGGRVAAIYGYRNEPYGIRAKISEDAGVTWSDEFVLCDDGREWDLGYIRAAKREDGKILAIYYHTTEAMPDEFIACTIWDPPSVTTPMRQLAVAEDGTIIDQPMRFSPDEPGVPIESEHALLQPDRGDFSIHGKFRTALNQIDKNQALIDNQHALGGFGVMVGRSSRGYHGKLFFCVTGPGEGDDVTLYSDERVDDDRPHTFSVSVKDGVMRMIVDGVEQKTTATYGSGTTANAPPQAPVTIGANFVGTISELRIEAGHSSQAR